MITTFILKSKFVSLFNKMLIIYFKKIKVYKNNLDGNEKVTLCMK